MKDKIVIEVNKYGDAVKVGDLNSKPVKFNRLNLFLVNEFNRLNEDIVTILFLLGGVFYLIIPTVGKIILYILISWIIIYMLVHIYLFVQRKVI